MSARTPGRTSKSDSLTQKGANDLATIIEAYWSKQGFAINTRIEVLKIGGGRGAINSAHVIRSNLGENGYPPARLRGAPQASVVYRRPEAEY